MELPDAEDAPEALLALESGIGVIAEGAVLAGSAERAGMLLPSSFLPQAPSAKTTERVMIAAATRVFTNFICM